MSKIDMSRAVVLKTPYGLVFRRLLRCRGCLTERFLKPVPFVVEDLAEFRAAHRRCPEPQRKAIDVSVEFSKA